MGIIRLRGVGSSAINSNVGTNSSFTSKHRTGLKGSHSCTSMWRTLEQLTAYKIKAIAGNLGQSA